MKNWIASIQDNISRADLLSEHYLSHAPTSIIPTFDAYISQVTSFCRLTQLITVNRTKKNPYAILGGIDLYMPCCMSAKHASTAHRPYAGHCGKNRGYLRL